MSKLDLYKFVKESNEIEGIHREPQQKEIDELKRFIYLDKVTISELERFLSVYQPDAKLRNTVGMDVRIRNYVPPLGGPEIVERLQKLLDTDIHAYYLHIEFELLHPFMDGNGRVGRALWAWKMASKRDKIINSFLYNFYKDFLS